MHRRLVAIRQHPDAVHAFEISSTLCARFGQNDWAPIRAKVLWLSTVRFILISTSTMKSRAAVKALNDAHGAG